MANGCILVVDDEREVEEAYEGLLESSGYEHISYNDAESAFYFLMINHSNIDLALIDLTMPDVTGADIAKQMAFIDPALPIIIMTGHMETEHIHGNVRAVLHKPIAKADLLAAVERHKRQPSRGGCQTGPL